MNVREQERSSYDVRFKTPFTSLLAGPSQSGKSSFVFNFLRTRHELMDMPTSNIIYFYSQWQQSFSVFEKEGIVTKWINELPTLDMLKEETEAYKEAEGSIVIVDDFMQQVNGDISDLFTVLCHSYHISVFLLSQNVFPQNPMFRNISLNSTYIILFKNPRDSSQIMNYAKQFAPGNTKWVVDAYRACTRSAYSYMLFDHHQKTEERIRVRSNIFPSQWPMCVWMSKENVI